MEVIRKVGRDIGHKTQNIIRRSLLARSGRFRRSQTASQETPDVDLGVRKLVKPVIAVAPHQVPFLAEVVIDARRELVCLLRQENRGEISLSIALVTSRRVIGQRHELRPKLRDQRIQTQVPGVAGYVRTPASRRLVGY